MKIIITRLILSSFLLVLIFPIAVQAQSFRNQAPQVPVTQTRDPSNERMPVIIPSPEKVQEMVRERVSEIKTQRCERIRTQTGNRLQLYVQSRERHLERLGNVQNRVEKIILEAESKGVDVSKIRLLMEEFKTHLSDFRANFEEFSQSFLNLVDFGCQEQENSFRGEVEKARNYMIQVREISSEMLRFLQNELKTALLEIVNDLKTQVE